MRAPPKCLSATCLSIYLPTLFTCDALQSTTLRRRIFFGGGLGLGLIFQSKRSDFVRSAAAQPALPAIQKTRHDTTPRRNTVHAIIAASFRSWLEQRRNKGRWSLQTTSPKVTRQRPNTYPLSGVGIIDTCFHRAHRCSGWVQTQATEQVKAKEAVTCRA